MASVAALIPAAGEGIRLRRGPKALVDLAGKSLLRRAAEAFGAHVGEVWVALAPNMEPRATLELGTEVRFVRGGATRQESVYNLLVACDADVVLIHDAARPFLPASVVAAVKEAIQTHGAASVVTDVADTLIDAASGKAVDRQRLRSVQTPQGFERTLILRAHRRALELGYAATDDAGLVRCLGHPVALVAGSSWLFKVTTPADLELATVLAAHWDAVGGGGGTRAALTGGQG